MIPGSRDTDVTERDVMESPFSRIPFFFVFRFFLYSVFFVFRFFLYSVFFVFRFLRIPFSPYSVSSVNRNFSKKKAFILFGLRLMGNYILT